VAAELADDQAVILPMGMQALGQRGHRRDVRAQHPGDAGSPTAQQIVHRPALRRGPQPGLADRGEVQPPVVAKQAIDQTSLACSSSRRSPRAQPAATVGFGDDRFNTSVRSS